MPQIDPEPAPDVTPLRSLADVVTLASDNRDMQFKVMLRRYVRPVRIEPGRLEIGLTDDAPRDLPGQLGERLKKWTGRRWVVSVAREGGGPTLAEEEDAKRESVFMDARADPAVAAVLARFPGARIIDVRIPEAAAGEAADNAPVAEAGLDPAPDADDDET